MSTSTKIGIGILAGLAVYLVYRMFSGYNGGQPATAGNMTAGGLQASNLQSAGAPTTPQGQDYYVPTAPPPAAGPAYSTRKGAGHF